mmetsp:Transcript_73665/g.102334  ORF Transcript_73665/g.102334 Transcript_73665/m.102334 type:complete len:221 (+) Transcript_73665:83-745(+)
MVGSTGSRHGRNSCRFQACLSCLGDVNQFIHSLQRLLNLSHLRLFVAQKFRELFHRFGMLSQVHLVDPHGFALFLHLVIHLFVFHTSGLLLLLRDFYQSLKAEELSLPTLLHGLSLPQFFIQGLHLLQQLLCDTLNGHLVKVTSFLGTGAQTIHGRYQGFFDTNALQVVLELLQLLNFLLLSGPSTIEKTRENLLLNQDIGFFRLSEFIAQIHLITTRIL